MTMPPDTPQRLRAEMSRCGYTLEALSKETDISEAVLRNTLAGRASAISTRSLLALSRAFGYSLGDFIDILGGAKEYPRSEEGGEEP